MRWVYVAAFTVALTSVARAEIPAGLGLPLGGPIKEQTPEEAERERIQQKAYKDSLRKIPDAGPIDPWGNVRGQSAPAAAPKPAPKAAVKKPVPQSAASQGAKAN